MCFYGKKMAFCSASGLRSQIFRCAQNDRDRQQNNCQEYYFSLVKKSKNTFCHPPSSQGWSDLGPKMAYILLPSETQRLIQSLNFSHIFVQRKSCAHIRDSRAVSFAYLCSRIVYLYTSPVCSHTLSYPCATSSVGRQYNL